MPQLRLKLLVGRTAQAWHLGENVGANVTETVSNWRDYLDGSKDTKGSIACLPLPHPSWRNTGWIRKNQWFGNELLPELRGLIQQHLGESSN
jgi:uracil-DNA glycosylase